MMSSFSKSMDSINLSQQSESQPMFASNESLRQPVGQMSLSATNVRSAQSSHRMSESTLDSSIWLRRQAMSGFGSLTETEPNPDDKYCLLMKSIAELDCEHLELIGIEQQIQAIALKCKSIRSNVDSKTNSIHSIISQMFVKPKQTAQKQTQTEVGLDYNEYNKALSEANKSSPLYPRVNPNKTFHLSPEMSHYCEGQSSRKDTNSSCSLNNSFVLSTPLKRGFGRLPALAKGYLTRRLMKTDKVIHLRETIRDTTQLLESNNIQSENRPSTVEDMNFQERLETQLKNICHQLYDIFLNYPKSAQMALIRRSREQILDRHFRTGSAISHSTYMTPNAINNPQKKGLSSVTIRKIEKKNQTISIAKGSQQNSPHSTSISNKASAASGVSTPRSSAPSAPSPFSRPPTPVVPLNAASIQMRRSQRITANTAQALKRKANYCKNKGYIDSNIK